MAPDATEGLTSEALWLVYQASEEAAIYLTVLAVPDCPNAMLLDDVGAGRPPRRDCPAAGMMTHDE